MFVRCTECNKKISGYYYNLDEYGYRIGKHFFCGYECMRTFEKRNEPKRKFMQWQEQDATTIVAKGEYGAFRITKRDNMFWARYHGTDNTHFTMQGCRQLSRAKQKCEESEYWESEV